MNYMKEKYIEEETSLREASLKGFDKNVEELEQDFEEIMRVKKELSQEYGIEIGFYEAKSRWLLDQIDGQIRSMT